AEILFMRREDLMAVRDQTVRDEQFPDVLVVGGARLPLRYKLEPAAADDGVTIRLPLEAVAGLDDRLFEWLVPGMLEEKVSGIVKSLPKHLRRALPHPSAFMPECIEQLAKPEGSLFDRLATIIRLKVGVPVSPDELRAIELPAHQLMNFEVVDGQGQVLASGRSLGAIRVKLAPQIRDGFARLRADSVTRDNIKRWDFGDLPERVSIQRFGMVVDAFPGLVDRGTSVSIKLFDSAESAAEATRFGLRRLCMLSAAEDFNRYTQFLPAADRLAFQYAAIGKASELKPVLRELIADRAFLADQSGSIAPERYPRDDEAFEKLVSAGLSRLGRAMDEVTELVASIFSGMYAVRAAVGEKPPAAWAPVLADIREQLDHLAPAGFLGAVPYEWLRHYPRYLAAIQKRVGKLVGDGLTKDLRKLAEYLPYWRAYVEMAQRGDEGRRGDAALHQYRWMLEEYRVSLFAQELRTSITVSPKRLDEHWATLAPKAGSATPKAGSA
ncbi:MAG: DUF3418 domain-containing protein, partial [Phycisphaerales bacterium]